jgi:tRNA-2-methylthio-N6-dimethylallyladenosine synthase
MKYHITTYGCQMNVHESEKLAGMLENMGYELASTQQEADVLVFNTCAIREGAEHRVFGNVGALKQMKKENPNKIVAVCGCMTQQKEVAEKMYSMFPFVNIIFGTHNLPDFEKYLNDYKTNKKRILQIEDERENAEYVAMVRSSGDNAWVNIMYGCNNFCTYCIVPYVRGREKSRSKQAILNEIKDLVAQNKYKTITLLGQNVNSYGNDNPQKNGNFAQLLADICAIEGDFKLTFLTSHPKDLTDDVITQIALQPKILKEIHLPVQSGSNRILKLMNRKYTREHYLSVVNKIKTLIPNARITTDFIVGFPSETEQDFEQTMSLLQQVEFDMVFAFMYSKRPHTPAEKMPDQVDEQTKHRRVNQLLALAKQIQNKKQSQKAE